MVLSNSHDMIYLCGVFWIVTVYSDDQEIPGQMVVEGFKCFDNKFVSFSYPF